MFEIASIVVWVENRLSDKNDFVHMKPQVIVLNVHFKKIMGKKGAVGLNLRTDLIK